MPQPYSWIQLENKGENMTSVSPRSGHTVTATNAGYVIFGGMDGRRNDQGNPAPNADLYILKLRSGYGYEWQMVDLDPSSNIPPPRTLHSATSISDDEIFMFGGTLSTTPHQCLQDGWILDTTCWEWKRIHFKADQKDRKNLALKRMTGQIEEVLREIHKGAAGVGSKRGSRGSISGARGSRLGFADLAGAAAKALGSRKPGGSSGGGARGSVAPGGQASRKTWKSILNKKMSVAPSKTGAVSGGAKPATLGQGGSGMGQSARDAFHDDLVHLVSNKMALADDGAEVPPNVPAPRANHTAAFVDNNIVLFGGHGGIGYQRRPCGDTHVLNLDNDRWQELACQGNPPTARCGHCSFAKDGYLFVFGGWNNELQFNDLFTLDVENKDWSDLDMPWGVPRWNCNAQVVEAIPSWRVFIFGGVCDKHQEGRSLGVFDVSVGVLDLGEKPYWLEPDLESPPGNRPMVKPAGREHSAMCYDREESRLVVFGGWSNKWLDDIWQINVSSVVGPPYAISTVTPKLGPVTGNQVVRIYGTGFMSTSGMVNVSFTAGKHSVPSQGHVVEDGIVECKTPEVVATIGPKKCEIRLQIGVRDYTTTLTTYDYYLNTIAERSMCYGPGLLEDGQADVQASFIIQARNQLCENRKSGADDYVITIIQDKQEVPFEMKDYDNGRYEIFYTPVAGEVQIKVNLVDENNKERPIRGSPFKPSFVQNSKPRANELAGPLMIAFIPKTTKEVEDFAKTTDSGISIPLKEGDVHSLIKVMNSCEMMWKSEDYLQRRMDEVEEVLAMMLREGLPNEKAGKQLKKISDNVTALKQKVKEKEKEIEPLITKESDIYKKKIQEFEESLKVYQSGLKKEAYCFYLSGLEFAQRRLDEVTAQLDKYDDQMADLLHIATNFQYPEDLTPSKKVMGLMREDVAIMRSLWKFEDTRIQVTEGFLVLRWGDLNPLEMEEEIKNLFKMVKEVKVDKKCDAFVGMTEVVKKWMVFCPLVAELRDKAMRKRHWSQLMELCGKNVDVTDEITLRDMWNMELHKSPEAVEEITDQAKQEAKMEITLAKLRNNWKDVEFAFDAHKGTEVLLSKMNDEDFEMLEENQLGVQNMFASRFLSTFETECLYWQKSLANVNEVSQLIAEVQRSWAFLENLFVGSEEVKKELPEESERFVGIDEEVKAILARCAVVKSCVNFCNEAGMFGKLEKVQTQLTMCEKALNDFMDGKRRAFPRFYFMSSADLLDVLSNGNQPAQVVKQFPKFFNCINTYFLSFPDGEGTRPHAIGLESCVGIENVMFPEPLPLVGKVEIYLDKCIEAFKQALWFYAKKAYLAYINDECSGDPDKRGDWCKAVECAQACLLVNNLTWCLLIEGAFKRVAQGEKNAMLDAYDTMVKLLLGMIKVTQSNIDKPTRQKVMCTITLDAHSRDIQDKMNNEGVMEPTAFQWQAQLKSCWEEEKDDARQMIADARFWYGYEYLGNGPRLVVTPLTDRIYVTATQALHLCMGCAPAGPAGTGKTETTKDLANALAKACYVINAAPEMDYLTMGNLFKGGAASGSWLCFDEYNRLIPEVLSVNTVQFKAVCEAVKIRAKRFVLQGDEIAMDPSCGCFITMNPGYLGRSELPEGLKALFRPITVMVPDFNLIMENMFMGEGFLESKALGRKFAVLYELNKDLLSKAPQYDWGMRAIKSVLVVAGTFKRDDPSLAEQAVLMRSLRDTNVAKIDGDDRVIFMGLLSDLFPGIDVPRARDLEWEALMISLMEEEMGYTHDAKGYMVLKTTQLIELLMIRHCIFMMGPPGSFKSAVWRILAKTKDRLGDKMTITDYNPKAFTTNEVYGFVNMATREWKDGVQSKTMRTFSAMADTHKSDKPATGTAWIMLDGDLDANWIESMNSVMDDNRLLTLPSNERIVLKPHMKMIFEIRDLSYATPATVTRAGVVLMADYEGVQWRSFQMSWIRKLEQATPKVKEELQKYFDKYCPDACLYMKKSCKVQVPMVDIAMVDKVCYLLDSFVMNNPQPQMLEALEYWFVFCVVWACGGCLSEVDGIDYRKQFSNWWKNEMKTIKFPTKGTVFDYFVKESRMEEWATIVDTIEYSSETPMGEVTVPNTETVAMSYCMKALLVLRVPVMLIGLAGCGKTQTCNGLLKNLDPEIFCSHSINFNFYTDFSLLMTMMDIPLEKKAGRLFAPPGKLKLIYFIDDLNMPALDKYNTQTAISLLRQVQEYGHWWDMTKIQLKDIGNTQYLSCMNPTAGSFIVNPRLQRWFWTLAVPFPEQSALNTVYTTFMKGHFERLSFKASVNEVVSSIIKAALSVHSSVASTFRKTAANFHYEFNIRHLSGVFSGLLQANPKEFIDAEKLVALWLHESERIYGDRLVSVADLKKYKAISVDMAKKMFGKFNFAKYFQDKNPEPLVFAPFSKGHVEDPCYDQIKGLEALSGLLMTALNEYNETNAAMDLVLFEDAMKHVSRVSRIVSNSSGHALLVGVGGSGRQSLSRLSAFISSCNTFMIVISSAYGLNDLKTDLQTMYLKAGVKDEGVMFLFTDSQITNEKFLVYINDLLSSGEVADLYAAEDKDGIRNNVRGGCKSSGLSDTPENLWNFFIGRIRKNLHMSICFSPVGDDMRNRAKKFPALITCTVIDWFQPWPFDALQSVAAKFLHPMEIFGEEDSPLRTGCVSFFPNSFEATEKVSQKFMRKEKRFSYSTPKSFLELLKQYTGMLGGKVDALEDKKERLTNGLEKLRVTQEQVAALEEVLTEKAEVVKVKVAEAEVKAEEVGAEKAKVSMETEKANVVAAEAEDISKRVNIQKASCEKDLAAALPLVAQAEAALDVLNVKDFQELKSLAKPPAGVDKLLESVMHLFCGIDPAVEVDKKGRLKDASWKAAGKCMANPGVFLQNLKGFKGEIDDMRVTQQNVDGARGVKDALGDEFSEEVFRKKSSAAAGLVVWVINIIMYYDVVVQVEPKRMALKEATETLENAQEKLRNAKELVAQLEKQLGGLMAEFDKVMKDKEATVAEAKKCSDKLDMAKRLINALGANGIIWEQTVSTVADDLVFIPGDTVVACAFSSYVGIFTRDYREEALDMYMTFLRKNNVPLGPKPDPLSILCTEAEQAAWGTQGLPNDRVSLENGAIMMNSQRWCLIIDPQLQGIVWIKNKDTDNGLVITRMGHSKMVNTFEQSIDQGKPVLIEALAETVDAVLQPVITRSTIKRGTKRMIKLGDKEINYSPNFRLMMQTKLSNPHYPPEIQAECTCINFTVTEQGLEDQMLFLVVRLERPDLAREKSRLIQQQNEFKVKLAELEALLLEKLANAEGDILEDTDLILSLEDAKKTSDEVKEKVIIATETETKINETSENYRPSANRGALVFFLMMDLRKIHSFYKYSLDAFLVVVTRAIESITLRKPKEVKEEVVEEAAAEEEEEGDEDDEEGEEGEEGEAEEAAEPEEEEEEIIELTGKDLKNRVDLLAKTVTVFVWNYIARGLFSSHKLIVASMLAFRILVRNNTLNNEEVNTLYICPPDANPPAMPENCKSWILEVQWAMLKTLESIPAFKSTAGALTQNMEQDSLGWKRWFSEEKAEVADLPRSFRDLSPFHRLMLLRVLRPDRIGAALVQFVQDNLGNEYIEMDPFSIEVAYAESSNLSPLFFVLFPGTDPTSQVEWMAGQLGMTDSNGKFVNISMGQGQEQIALNGLRNQAQNGGWIMLQNIHLMQSWLPQLDRALEVIEEVSHQDFRCVLSSEPPSAPGVPLDEVMLIEIIPEATLQRCIKIADEAPADLKSNLRRAYSKFGPDNIEACQKQKEFKGCLFSLCFFHSLIVGRRRFGPQGYSKSYPFNDGDLTICGAVLCNYLNAYENVPWPDLRYIFGEIMYGGHITDPWDRRITNTYLKVLITPELFNNMNLCPGFKSPDATKFEYQHYVKYTEEKFPAETPQMFWLHPNAEIGFLTSQGLNVFSTIMKISGGGGGGGGGDIGASQEHITTYLGLLPIDMDMFEIRSRITEYTPYIIVSLQESERMNVLLQTIRQSLLELELGIAGALNISDGMESLSAKLQINGVDANWAKKAYPSLKGLATWFSDLVLRVDQLVAWTAQLSLLKSLWLSGFFNPMSFLTAVMQVNARTNNLPLDFMVNRCTFTNSYEVHELNGQPATGVYGHGLFMEGAGWEDGKGDEEGYITDSKLKDLHPQMPICNVFAVHVDEMSWDCMYRCPVYVTANRGPDYVFSANVRMDADDTDVRWILAGGALLMTDD